MKKNKEHVELKLLFYNLTETKPVKEIVGAEVFVTHRVNSEGETVVKYLRRGREMSSSLTTIHYHDLLVEQTLDDKFK